MKFSITSLQNIALIFLCLWITSPILTPNDLARLAALAALGAWVGLELSRPNGIFWRPTLPVFGALLFIFYDLVLWYGLREWGLLSHIQMYILLTLLIVYESRRHDPRSLAPVFWAMMVTLPIWFFATFRAFDTFGSHAARTVVRSSEEAVELMQQGVGGYSLIYSGLILVPIMISMTMQRRKFDMSSAPRPLRLLPVITLVLIVAVVLNAGFSIAILLLMATLMISLAYLKPRPWKLVVAPPLAVVLILVAPIFLIHIVDFLMPFAEGTNFALKLRDIRLSLELGGSIGTVNDRTERYLRSINSFLENPLLGVMGDRGVGKHSEYLDHFAQRGVLFGALYMALLLYVPLRMLRRTPGMLGMTGGVLTIIILLPFLNSLTMTVGVALFIMFPAACGLTMGFGKKPTARTLIQGQVSPA
ncbi:hypothetical protein RM543_17835 [Roseicyclus sp. F158]|uniref:O-antigen ligase domain-containing protein n=1 Tax=Tropicimonas omnivorans TaxID=3075590 RepID=A0ABU3DLF2_9RHOB|nr:hypothetical protein [Roseicyclus sp. F158]MDT0684536.1 hypothetical protein [Roseicyclus sp. F158]